MTTSNSVRKSKDLWDLRAGQRWLLVLMLTVFSGTIPSTYGDPLPAPRDGLLVLTNSTLPPDWTNSLSGLRSLGGFTVSFTNTSGIGSRVVGANRVLYVPQAVSASLDDRSAQAIAEATHEGGALILEGKSLLAEKIGISFSGATTSTFLITDTNHPTLQQIEWREPVDVPQFNAPESSAVCFNSATTNPVLVCGTFGQGRYLFSAVELERSGEMGYTRFPFLHETIITHFDLRPWVRRDRLSVYLDWGYHWMEDPNELAQRLKDSGISEVHLSCWYDLANIDSFYRTFIPACHARGILVYCWFELPHVDIPFWDAHPEWREKTADGKDALLFWRYLMALEIPECLAATKEVLKSKILPYDWDGIDLAELYFGTENWGFSNSELFTPMCDYVRADFKSIAGIDPAELFDTNSPHYYEQDTVLQQAYIDYRTHLVTDLNERMLQFFIDTVSPDFHRPLDIYLTQVDTILLERMASDIGVDPAEFVRLQKTYGITLQIEDPWPLWSFGPDRYRLLGEAYREELGPEARLTLDINVVVRTPTKWPTRKQTGLELITLLSTADRFSDQVCLYSAETLLTYDWAFVPYSMTSSESAIRTKQNSYTTSASRAFKLEADIDVQSVELDSIPWPCFTSKYVIVPPGQHNVVINSTNDNGYIRVTDLSGELSYSYYTNALAVVGYNDHRQCLVSLSFKPTRVFLDGKQVDLPISQSLDGRYATVHCPPGDHEVRFGDLMPEERAGFKLAALPAVFKHFYARVEAPKNHDVVVEVSSDLLNWTVLTTNRVEAEFMLFLDEFTSESRFYRARIVR